MQHVVRVTGLLVLSILVQVVMIYRAPVPALDAVRFVRVARQMDRNGVVATLRGQGEQAMFPAWVCVVHGVVRRMGGEPESAWAVSAQVAAAVFLVLSVIPVYAIAIRLFGAAAGLAGTLFYCVLPEVCRLGASGISDSMHLFFFAVALWAVFAYFHRPGDERVCDRVEEPGADRGGLGGGAFWGKRGWGLTLGGLATGAALTVRSEILVLPAALAVTLAGYALVAGRRGLRRLAGAGCVFALGWAISYGPYLAAVGSLAPGEAWARMTGRGEALGGRQAAGEGGELPRLPEGWRLADGREMSFEVKEPAQSTRRRGLWGAAWRFGEELADCFGYGIGLLAVLGLWRLRRELGRPVDRFAQVFLVVYAAAVFGFVAREGYIEARHLVVWVVIGTGLAGYGGLVVGRWVGGWAVRLVRVRQTGLASEGVSGGWRRSAAAWVGVALAGAACLVDLAWPLNDSQLGHRQAGAWLAAGARVPGEVLDTRGWTGLYSGRATWLYDEARAAFARERLAYVVVEEGELAFSSTRAGTLWTLLAVAGERVAVFPEPAQRARHRRRVVVYRWYPDRMAAWAAGQP